MHVAPGAPMAIAVLWMRDADALEVQVYKGADELGKLASYKNSFLGAAEKAPIPQQATFEILKTTWYASAPILTRQPLLAARAAPRWAAGLLSRAGLHACTRAALFHHSGCRGSPSAPWASELSCGGDSSTADRATSSRWMQTPLGLLCAEANVSYGSVAQRREAE